MPETVPDGFAPHFKKSKVTGSLGAALFARASAVRPDRRPIARRARNSRGFVHGGVIAALADNAMGLSFVRVFKASRRSSEPGKGRRHGRAEPVDYVATAKLGQSLQIEPRGEGRPLAGVRRCPDHRRRRYRRPRECDVSTDVLGPGA